MSDMGVRPHETGDKLSPPEFITTAFYWQGEYAEEMDFVVTPGSSEAAIREVAEEWGKENLEPYDKITFGNASCGMVYF